MSFNVPSIQHVKASTLIAIIGFLLIPISYISYRIYMETGTKKPLYYFGEKYSSPKDE